MNQSDIDVIWCLLAQALESSTLLMLELDLTSKFLFWCLLLKVPLHNLLLSSTLTHGEDYSLNRRAVKSAIDRHYFSTYLVQPIEFCQGDPSKCCGACLTASALPLALFHL